MMRVGTRRGGPSTTCVPTLLPAALLRSMPLAAGRLRPVSDRRTEAPGESWPPPTPVGTGLDSLKDLQVGGHHAPQHSKCLCKVEALGIEAGLKSEAVDGCKDYRGEVLELAWVDAA